jgi:membrane protease YdiL (CAAX protease family)
MSTAPEQVPPQPEDPGDQTALQIPSTEPLPPDSWANDPEMPQVQETLMDGQRLAVTQQVESASEPTLFASYSRPELPRAIRIPNFGHLCLLLLLLCFGWLGAGSLLLVALHFHLFGISTLPAAINDFRYTLGSQAIQYFIALAGSLIVFPLVWHEGFFVGIQWRGSTALRLRGRLITAAVLCFVAAMINGLLLPGPTDAPIDRMFRVPGAAWVLFIFGVTLAPFFEELVFRGFLLPTLCTAYDWIIEKANGTPSRPLHEDGSPQWSLAAMAFASVVTSVPFALMHGEQTSYSVGPFLLLICVSLVLCWVRLSARSLAASTMVHACYNFLLFFFMLLGTGGFKHFDKM